MLHKIEKSETTPILASEVSSAHEKVPSQNGIILQVQDKELAELAACLAPGISRRKKYIGTLFSLSISLVVLSIIALPLRVTDSWPGFIVELVCLLVGIGTVAVAVGGHFWGGKNRHTENAALKRLADIDDVRAVASILDALRWMKNRAPRSELWQALGHLLPRLTEEEAWELGKERHGMLAFWIQAWDNPTARQQPGDVDNQPLIGMLGVMAHIGQNRLQVGIGAIQNTVSLLSTLERWAEGKGAGQDPDVQQAAQACREAILQKMALAKSGEHLLRASNPTPASPETLLRPAQNTEQTDPQELLRPDRSE